MTSMPPRFAATVIGQLSGEALHARALIQRIAQRSDSALRELNRLVQRRIYAFALQRLGRTDEAAAVVNETLWEVWRRAASFDGSCKVTTWMLGIARYKALELMRARSAHADDLDSVKESLADANADPFDRIAALQLSTELLRGIAGLAVDNVWRWKRTTCAGSRSTRLRRHKLAQKAQFKLGCCAPASNCASDSGQSMRAAEANRPVQPNAACRL